ncbi:MAG: VOC family protein [Syntrophorhabdales bacterium]|jgi:hypothetical protein
MFKRLRHVGNIVKNLDDAIMRYCDTLHVTPSDVMVISLKGENMRSALIPLGTNVIELLEITGPAPRPRRYLHAMREKEEGLFHLTMFADDFDGEVTAIN